MAIGLFDAGLLGADLRLRKDELYSRIGSGDRPDRQEMIFDHKLRLKKLRIELKRLKIGSILVTNETNGYSMRQGYAPNRIVIFFDAAPAVTYCLPAQPAILVRLKI